jgi:hypothetical protein
MSKEPGKHQEHKLSGVISTHSQTVNFGIV